MPAVLHNQISNQLLRTRILANEEQRITVSFYRYFGLSNIQSFRDNLYQMFTMLHIFGRVYIATEGINAQISVPQNSFHALRESLYAAHPQLDGLRFNIALDNSKKSFWVLRMKVRPYLVADGIKDPTFNPANVGYYLKAEEVNDMADDPDTLFVDMRNHYEYEVGHFNHALEIPSDTFREQLPMVLDILRNQKNKKIVLYCTGGIRCEKASAWIKHNGFKNVYHIEGGIITYVRRAQEKGLPIKFIGKNFVFDERLGERITPEIIAHCHQCGVSYDSHTNCLNQGCHLLFIQCPICASKYEGCCSVLCQKELLVPLHKKKQWRLAANQENNKKFFNKSSSSLQLRLNNLNKE